MRRQIEVYQRERAVALIWMGMMAVEALKWSVYPFRSACWARGRRAEEGGGGGGDWGGGRMMAVMGEERRAGRRRKGRERVRREARDLGWCIVVTGAFVGESGNKGGKN